MHFVVPTRFADLLTPRYVVASILAAVTLYGIVRCGAAYWAMLGGVKPETPPWAPFVTPGSDNPDLYTAEGNRHRRAAYRYGLLAFGAWVLFWIVLATGS